MSVRTSAPSIVVAMLLLPACGNAHNGGHPDAGGSGGGAAEGGAAEGGAQGGSTSGAGGGIAGAPCYAAGVAPARIALDGITGCAIDSMGALRCWGTALAGFSSAPVDAFIQITGRADVYGAVTTSSSLAFWGSTTLPSAPEPGKVLDQVAVNGAAICAIDKCGLLMCWPTVSADKYSLSKVPTGLFQQVAAGGFHECALDNLGVLSCWGSNTYGQTESPSGTFTSVTSGNYHSCAIASDGHVECWGAKNPDAGQPADFGQATPPTGTFKYLSAGELHTCGIKDDDTVACWGLGTTMGDCQGKTECGQAMPPPDKFQQIASGFTNTCGIKVDGSLSCWGSNTGGRSTPPSDFK